MSTPIVYAGMDVSKRKLDFHCDGRRKGAVANTPGGHEHALRWLRQRVPGGDLRALHLVCESSGGYERAFVELLWAHGALVSIVDPKRIDHHRKADGIMAKTDAKDAQLICEFAQERKPRPMCPPDSLTVRLRDLVGLRAALQEHLTQIGHRGEHIRTSPVGDSLARVTQGINDELKLLDTQIKETLAQHPSMGTVVQAMVQVQGIGWQTAITVLAYCPELGTLSRNKIAALAGLAPYNDDSGPRTGPRHIRGGRAHLRRSLYMAALTASRFNPILRDFYQRLRAKGKPAKVALTALMRKLLVALNAITRNILATSGLDPHQDDLCPSNHKPAPRTAIQTVPLELGVTGGQAPLPPEAQAHTPTTSHSQKKPLKKTNNHQRLLAT